MFLLSFRIQLLFSCCQHTLDTTGSWSVISHKDQTVNEMDSFFVDCLCKYGVDNRKTEAVI